jgi:hypothetical protein
MVKGGWSGLTWSDLEGAMGGLVNSLDSVAADLPPQLGGLLAMLEKMPTLLKNYKVQHQVGIMTAQGNRWVYQNSW